MSRTKRTKRTRAGNPVIGGWRRLSRRVGYRNPYFYVTDDKVLRPDGSPGTYSVVHTPHAVYVVPIDARGRTLLVRQARYPTGRYSWELPGGGLDGKTPLAAGKLELREEAGMAAARWRKLGALVTFSGICDEYMHVYLATGLRPVAGTTHAVEGIERTRWLPLEQALGWAKTGKSDQAQTIAALTLAALHLRK